ncbi:MAG: biotin-dependent carboxyltransferase family protein [Dokdonella sp.]|uniref:5-oxoprolinase subunit C family protein n=1 Tax=Dokdonella sp. TaxID=2291710 RepID=UPI003265DEE2
MSVHVLKPGVLSTVQDRGRVGGASFGIGHAGPMDEVAFRLANALVGNDNLAALEISVIGPRLRFDVDATIALTGAPFHVSIDGEPMAIWQPVFAKAGSVVDIGTTRRGTRAYLAVAGGFDLAPTLGSRATDIHAGLGPLDGRPLSVGDVLKITRPAHETVVQTRRRERGEASAHPKAWSLDPRPWFDEDAGHPIRLIRGTHHSALDDAALTSLYQCDFRISVDSNRVGYRLDGAHLHFTAPIECVSEAVAFGTVQLPPAGQPIVLMAEHPTTGGYPRIGQVAAVDFPRLAQRKPGDGVRFREIDRDDAQRRYLARERELDRFVLTIAERLATHE